jgi:hypothetical protein
LWPWGQEDPKRTLKRFQGGGAGRRPRIRARREDGAAFAHTIRADAFRRALLLLWHLLAEAGWQALGQGYLL